MLEIHGRNDQFYISFDDFQVIKAEPAPAAGVPAPVAAVAEPAGLMLLCTGLALMGCVVRFKC